MTRGWRREGAIDWVNLFLAAALALSPWLGGYADSAAATWTAVLLAALVAAVALAALLSFARWEEWLNAAFGALIVVAPWLVGFSDVAAAMWWHVVTGAVIAALALYEISIENRKRTRSR